MSARQIFSAAGDVAIRLLRLAAASAELVPPLKSAAASALYVIEIVQNFRSNKDEWKEFGTYVRDATASVVESLSQVDTSQGDIKDRLEKLKSVLSDIARKIDLEQSLGWHKRFVKFLGDPRMIADMRAQLDNTISLFELSTSMTTMIDVKKTFDAVIANTKILSGIAQENSDIATKATSISQNVTLEKLRRVQGASWDTYQVCLPNTRGDIIDRILAWIDGPSSPNEPEGAKILLFTGVASAGKTTIAHTIAQRCANDKLLASSFFFDRETEDRSTPAALFGTIAADLSRLDKRFAERLAGAIEDDRSLPSAPLSRQFEELVLKPSQSCPIAGPLVIVIDALDEA